MLLVHLSIYRIWNYLQSLWMQRT